jgi:GNAT superfamily N-acetyltransferase
MSTLVKLSVDDASDVHALHSAAYAKENYSADKHLPSLEQPLDLLMEKLADPDMVYYGLRDTDGELVAAICGSVDSDTATVERLCVHPEQQGKGHATQLLTELEHVVPSHVRVFRLFTGSDAAEQHHFYGKLGYKDVRHEAMDAGYTIIQMKKTLA